jgi:hypothetical protein
MTDELKEGLYRSELHLQKARYLQGAGADREAVAACFSKAAEVAREGAKHRTEYEALAAMQALADSASPDVAARLKNLADLRPELPARMPTHAPISS